MPLSFLCIYANFSLRPTVIGEDYTLNLPFVITYSAGGTANACNDITILNDTSLEGFHDFSVSIISTSLNPNVVEIPSQPLLIQIQDDERKCCPISLTKSQDLFSPLYSRGNCETSSHC